MKKPALVFAASLVLAGCTGEPEPAPELKPVEVNYGTPVRVAIDTAGLKGPAGTFSVREPMMPAISQRRFIGVVPVRRAIGSYMRAHNLRPASATELLALAATHPEYTAKYKYLCAHLAKVEVVEDGTRMEGTFAISENKRFGSLRFSCKWTAVVRDDR